MEEPLKKSKDNEDSISLLPIYEFRSDLQEMLHTIDTHIKSHPDYLAASMIALTAGLLGNKVILNAAGYENSPGLGIILVGRSTNGKSDPIKRFRKPIDEAENLFHKIACKEHASWVSTKDPKAIDKPHEKKFIEDDFTYEKLCEDLCFNPNGLIIVRDEIRSWVEDWGRYNKSGEGTKYITLLDGGRIRLSRKNSDIDIVISNALVSILGGIQVRNLKKVFTEDLITSGFMPRLLFCFPDVRLKKRCREPLPQNVMEPWADRVKAIIDITPRRLTLEPAAESLYYDYVDAMDKKQAWCTNDDYAALYGKEEINILRLTLATHFLSNKSDLRIIDKDEIYYNIELMKYFEKNWIKTYKATTSGARIMSKEELIRYLLTHGNPKAQQTSIADVVGVSKQYVSRIANE